MGKQQKKRQIVKLENISQVNALSGIISTKLQLFCNIANPVSVYI